MSFKYLVVIIAPMKRDLDIFKRLISSGAYFEAHEVLERSWLYYKQKNLALSLHLKGLINAAIAFEHIKRDRNDAFAKATKTFACYKRYSEDIQDDAFKPAIVLINAIASKYGLE